MGDSTSIEWTDATWNPATGCTKVSSGCDHCYAATLARGRLRHRYTEQAPVNDTSENREDPFAVRLWKERLDQPRRWRKPRMVFVNSMSDLFHNEIPDAFTRSVFKVMLAEKRHIYQVLTKRPARAAAFWDRNKADFGHQEIPEHIWIGTSVESQNVDYRIRHLREVPACVRFLSCEPLLGSMDLTLEGIHWVIVGGESGPEHRSPEADWIRDIRDQCLERSVPFFFKQWGGRTPKANGRELDGRIWDQYPVDLEDRLDQ